jgi:hypothetical protein
MTARGWTNSQIAEAIAGGAKFPAVNRETGSPATRYIHSETGRSVVVDDATGEVIHVGSDGFIY